MTAKRGDGRNAVTAKRPGKRRAVTAKRASPPARTAAHFAALEASIAALRATLDRLDAVPSPALSALPAPLRKLRSQARSDAALAIEELENAKLIELNAAFAQRRDQLEWATARLQSDVEQLADTATFLRAAAAAVGIIADLVALAAVRR